MKKRSYNSGVWIQIAGIVASILTIAQAITFFISSPTRPLEFIILCAGIIICVIALSVLLANSQIKNHQLLNKIKMTEENNRTVANDNKHYQNIISQLSKYNHNINHQLRQMFDELYEELFYGDEEDNSAISTEPGDKSEDQVNPMHIWRVENIRHKFRGFLQHFTTHVKAAFETLTNDNCAVYITLVSIGEDGSEYIAETYYRDPVSYTERTHLDARKDPYNVKLFTPFKFLFSGQESTLFACDDCLSYQNFSDVCDNWHDYYNACLTVPIRVRKSKENNTHKLIGFITVDNKKGGLNNKDAKNLLCSYADLIYALLGMFIDLGGTL